MKKIQVLLAATNVFVLTLAFSAILLVGCARGQKPDPETKPPTPPQGYSVAPFFPLEVGNTWRYKAHHLGETNEHEVRIVSREGAWFVDSEGERFLVDGEGLRGPDRYLLRAPLRPGEEWSSVVDLSVTEHYEITETGVSASVPAGTFHGCLRVVGRVRINPTITLFKQDTYCHSVGLVRVRTWLDAAAKGKIPQAELELVSYQLVDGD